MRKTNLRHTLSKYLRSLGSEVETANNGLTAYEIICRKDFDLILVDIKMPVMDGIELFQKINGEAPEKSQRIVFMSGLTGYEMRETSKVPNVPLLRKPFSRKELLHFFSFLRDYLNIFDTKQSWIAESDNT